MLYQISGLKVKKAYRGRKHIGRGLFTTKPIPNGAIVSVCPGLIIEDPKECDDYTFFKEDGCETFLALSPMSLANHSSSPNVEYDFNGDLMTFTAIEDIEAGEEITIDYGDTYWDARGIVPAKSKKEK